MMCIFFHISSWLSLMILFKFTNGTNLLLLKSVFLTLIQIFLFNDFLTKLNPTENV